MRLAIGTAQFGIDYGVSNKLGQVKKTDAKKILKLALENNINYIDTAISYGNSETVLGEIGISGWNCISKLQPIPQNVYDIDKWVTTQVTNSLKRLKLESLHALLLHKPQDILGQKGKSLLHTLKNLKTRGLIKNIGYSIYSPNDLDSLVKVFWPDIVQTPYNVFDQRMVLSKWLDKLVSSGTKVHARSIFLQGLLLMQEKNRPNYFNKWRLKLSEWDNSVKNLDLQPAAAAINFALSDTRFEKVVIGVNSTAELRELVNIKQIKNVNLKNLACDDLNLIEPFRWKI